MLASRLTLCPVFCVGAGDLNLGPYGTGQVFYLSEPFLQTLFVSFYGMDAPYFIFVYLSIGLLGCFHFEALRDNATGNSGIDVFS